MNEYTNDMSPYRAAGELAGITSLVDAFYSNMDTFPEARVIQEDASRGFDRGAEKTHVLSVRSARRPSTVYRSLRPESTFLIFIANSRLDTAERDAWMLCMQHATAVQPYEASFKEYLLARLWIPAERIRLFNEAET